MKEVQTNYDNILNPEEAFEDYKDKLVSLYKKDYGSDNLSLIKERMEDTVYVFDSTPVEEVNYFVENEKHYTDCFKIQKAFEECREFLNIKGRIEKKLQNNFYNFIAKKIGVSKGLAEQITYLDVDSFSKNNQELLRDDRVPNEVRKEIKLRQEEYIAECERLGVFPLTDSNIIEDLFKYQDNLEKRLYLLLTKLTKWGQRIRKQISQISGIKLSFEDLSEVLFGYSVASNNMIYTSSGVVLRVCYFPVVKNFSVGNMDGSFFHENRHVIESKNDFCGIECFETGQYTTLNEIRTEKNAGKDKSELKNVPLFSNAGYKNGHSNIYTSLFPYTEDFFEKYEDELNKIAVFNDINKLESLFGSDNLREFDEYLSLAQECLYEDDDWKLSLVTSEQKQKKIVLELNKSFNSRQY